jgi:hypothetical protein
MMIIIIIISSSIRNKYSWNTSPFRHQKEQMCWISLSLILLTSTALVVRGHVNVHIMLMGHSVTKFANPAFERLELRFRPSTLI